MSFGKAMRRGVPIVLLGAAATVVLRKRLQPRPALPPGDPTAAGGSPPVPADAATTSALIAEHSAAIIATAATPAFPAGTPSLAAAQPVAATPPSASAVRFARRLRRAPVDIVTVVDDLLGAAR